MHIRSILVASGAALLPAFPAAAADQLKFGAAPSWVAEQVIPPASAKVKDKPVAVLLHDQQTMLEPGKISTFSELAFKIQKPEGLGAGNISIPWNPATDTVTVNRLEIRRGDQVIDVLKSGQTFTTLRRETNLDLATLDGMLTANIQPEGLQEGDVVVLATTTDHVDPVLKGHVEAVFAPWSSAQIGLAHARLAWPSTLDIKIRKSGDLPASQPTGRDGKKVYELTMRDVEPMIEPKGAPMRFRIGRMGEATDFRSWADAAKLLMPLFRDAAVVPASGPLRDEVEKIRKASADPKARTEQALHLVEQRIRYVALVMGQGSYVPATAETTWSRRFGDCKAKTALLLAILHELEIKAEPVVVNAIAGDVIADRLPSIGMFNHVLVRAHVGGNDYWLDGTRTGDTSLGLLQVPDFGWGLPLVENAQLVHLMPAPLEVPSTEHRVSVDASAGIYAPAPVTIEEVYRGDSAVEMNTLYSALSAEQRDEQLRDNAKGYFDNVTVDSSSVQFDKDKRELAVTIKGTAKLNWKDGWDFVPTSSIAFNPDFDRPAGPQHEASLAVSYPSYAIGHATIRLPDGVAAQQKLSVPVHETLAGVEYTRTETVSGNVLTVDTSERSLASEVLYKDALAAAPRLRALDKDDVYLSAPAGYRSTANDLTALATDTPISAADYVSRASAYQFAHKYDETIADLNAALALDPKNTPALLMRAYAYRDKGAFAAAEKDVSSAEAIDPALSSIPEARTLIAYSRKDNAGVIESATKAIAAIAKEGPDGAKREAAIYAIRADAFLHLGKVDEALADLTADLALNPKDKWALNKRAWIYASKHDFAGAEKDIAAIEALDPANLSAIGTRAYMAEENMDYERAVEQYSKLLLRDPKNKFALTRRGLVLSTEGKKTEAIQDLTAVIAADPADTDALLNRAAAEMEANDLDAAERDVRTALAKQPDRPSALATAGRLAERRGDHQAAIKDYTKQIEAALAAPLPPQLGETQLNGVGGAFVARAGVYRSLVQYDKALSDTDAALKAGYKGPDLRVLRANILLQSGKRDLVAAEAEAMMKDNPGSDYAFVAAGKILAALGQIDKAMRAFDRALAIKPHAYIYINRAQVRPKSDFAGRMADLDAALQLEPDSSDALAEKARLLTSNGDYKGALTIVQRMKTDPNDAYAELQRAITFYRAGRTEDAQKIFADLRAKAKSPLELNNLCWSKATANAVLESALDDCRDALKLKPDTGQYLDSLGMVLLKLGRLDEALDAYNRAIAKSTGADSLMGRAFVYLRKGDRLHAEADAAAARKLSANIDDTFADYGLEFSAKATDGRTNRAAKAVHAP